MMGRETGQGSTQVSLLLAWKPCAAWQRAFYRYRASSTTVLLIQDWGNGSCLCEVLIFLINKPSSVWHQPLYLEG